MKGLRTMNTNNATYTDVHEKLRKILMDSGAPEYGDNIIDDICRLFGYPLTPEVNDGWE